MVFVFVFLAMILVNCPLSQSFCRLECMKLVDFAQFISWFGHVVSFPNFGVPRGQNRNVVDQ